MIGIRLLQFALGATACVLAYLFLLNFQPIGKDSPTGGLVSVLVLAIGTWALTAWFLRADRLSPADLGFSMRQRPFLHMALGFLGGCVLTGLWLLIVFLAAGATWHFNPRISMTGILTACAFILFNNLGEELVYRGYAFVRIDERWGGTSAVIATSAIFASLHLLAGVPWLSVLAVVFTTGLVLGATFARWRSVPLALGVHVATNIVQEATGLRSSGASILLPEYQQPAATAGPMILAGMATINLVLAIGILRFGLKLNRR